MTVTYPWLNSIALAQPSHHGRPPRGCKRLVDDAGYPQPSMVGQRRRLYAGRHRGYKAPPTLKQASTGLLIRRGTDVVSGKYTGAVLRAIRKQRGVGRPWSR